jgi:hypothetical protein
MLIAALVIAVIFEFRLHHPHLPDVAKLTAPFGVSAPPQFPPVAPITPVRSPPASTAHHAGKSIEICGIGKVSGDDDDLKDAKGSIYLNTEQARSRWLASMLQSGDARVHATGLLFESELTRLQDSSTKPRAATTVNSMADLALDSQDPMVYAMADYICERMFGTPPAGTCEKISAKSWAAIDQDNAAAWMAAAREARAAKDTTGENAAYLLAAKATRIDTYAWSAFVSIAPTLPVDLGPTEHYRVLQGDAIQQLIMERAIGRDEANPWSCDAANRGNAFMRDWQRLGDLGAYERELAQEYRQSQAEFRRKAKEFRASKAQPEP